MDRAADAVESLVTDGLERTQQRVQQLTPVAAGEAVHPLLTLRPARHRPRADADADDHTLAAWAATEAGELLLEVRAQGLEGTSSRTPATRPRTSC